jgi:Holliday junction DNA helicase RuvA
MIGRLTGILLSKQAPELLLDVNGVAYEISAPMTTFYKLPEEGHKLSLHTHLVVREDAQLLYGFYEIVERSLFRLLIKTNGVGPKLALAILSGIEAQAFVQCIHDGDSSTLVKVPGVGKKTAERLVIEMRDKIKDWHTSGSAVSGNGVISLSDLAPEPSARNDAESALLALGYKSNEAAKAIAKIKETDLSSEALIRLALKNIR